MDRDEAARIIEVYVEVNPPDKVYDEVMVPALNFARLDRERDGLTEAQEQFILRETRAIVESHSQQHTSISASDELGADQDKSAAARPNVRILGCPARDESDEVALLMFQQLLASTRYQIEVVGDEKLASEVVVEAGEKQAGMVLIAAVQPGGLAHTRYLCKRLRAQFLDLKIVVGLWGFRGELEATRKSLLSAGADEVGTSLLESRDQLSNLGQLISESHSVSAPRPTGSQA